MHKIFINLSASEIKSQQLKIGVSNYSLAQKTGLSETSLSYLYRHQRRPTLYTLIMITKALNISLSDIIEQVEIQLNIKE